MGKIIITLTIIMQPLPELLISKVENQMQNIN